MCLTKNVSLTTKKKCKSALQNYSFVRIYVKNYAYHFKKLMEFLPLDVF